MCVALLVAGCGGPGGDGYTMPTDAMKPKFSAGQHFTARPVAAGAYEPRAGDVVVFRAPESWDRRGLSVARVVAVGGTVVACCDVAGGVTLDGMALDEPYLGEDSPIDVPATVDQCYARRFGPVRVEPGHVFVMGDSRGISVDSRCKGTVPSDRIVAVAA